MSKSKGTIDNKGVRRFQIRLNPQNVEHKLIIEHLDDNKIIQAELVNLLRMGLAAHSRQIKDIQKAKMRKETVSEDPKDVVVVDQTVSEDPKDVVVDQTVVKRIVSESEKKIDNKIKGLGGSF